MREPLLAPPFDELSALPRRRLAAMRRAAGDLFGTLEEFARHGRHPVRDVLAASAKDFTRWEHYPPGDVEDRATGCAWYYHAHDPSEARPWEEHGHFHCFMYSERVRAGATPISMPANPDFAKGGLIHLLAVSVDSSGTPTHLFAPNRWVTGEWMYPAADVIPLIDRFAIGGDTRFALTNRWLTAILRLFQPQIAWLLRDRDRVLAARREVDPAGFADDRSFEVVSTLSFDLDAQLAALDQASSHGSRRHAA